MKKILLTQGKVAFIDDDDFNKLSQYKWYLNNNGYAARAIGKCPNQKTVLMHRQIMNTPFGLETDHKNHNRLDNQKFNLRICTGSDNRLNQIKRGKQKYKGVRQMAGSEKYEARIQINDKRISLGSYNTNIEAARAYDKAAQKYHGEFAFCNFAL